MAVGETEKAMVEVTVEAAERAKVDSWGWEREAAKSESERVA